MREWLKRLIDYFLFVELFSLKQDQFTVNYKNRLLRREFEELYLFEGIKKWQKKRGDDFNGLFFKVHIGTLQLGALVEYALERFNEAEIPLYKDSDFEQIEELKRDKTYISLGYFYLNPKGQFITKSGSVYVRVLPFVFLLTLLERVIKERKGKKGIKELIGGFQDYFERSLSEFSKFVTEEYKTRESSLTGGSLVEEYLFSNDQEEKFPPLCFVLDSSAILDKSFDAEKLKELKDCILCVTPQVLGEIDLKKRARGYIRDQAIRFRKVFDEMITRARETQQSSSLAQGIWYPSAQSDKKVLIVSPYFDKLKEINPSYYGVDSEADMSVILAALEFSKKSFPIIVATDRAFKWSILQKTPFVGFSKEANLDVVLSDTELLEKMKSLGNKYCISYSLLVDIEKKFFQFFNLGKLYERLSLFKGEDFVKRHGFITIEIVPGGIEEIAKALSEEDVNYIIKDLTFFRKKFLEERGNSSSRGSDGSSINKDSRECSGYAFSETKGNSLSKGRRGGEKERVVSDIRVNRDDSEEGKFPRLVRLVLGKGAGIDRIDGEKNLQDDVLSKLNLSELRDALRCLFAQSVPVGRYASPYLPTLLQQIAINQALELREGQVLAVNGPPGTGKTTLLKEIIANLVVKRALEIARLKGEVFTSEGLLHDKVCKFKMVVVSNNNAAVENVTLELPKLEGVKEALSMCGEEYIGFNYLGSVIKEYFKAKEEEKAKKEEEEIESAHESNEERTVNLDLFSNDAVGSLEQDIDIATLSESEEGGSKQGNVNEGQDSQLKGSKEGEEGEKKEVGEFFGLLALPLGKFENRDKAARVLSIFVEDILEAIDKRLAIRRESTNISSECGSEGDLGPLKPSELNISSSLKSESKSSGIGLSETTVVKDTETSNGSNVLPVSMESGSKKVDVSENGKANGFSSVSDLDFRLLDAEFKFSSEEELESRIKELCEEIIQLENEIKKETESIFSLVRERMRMTNRLKELSKAKKELEEKLNSLRMSLDSLSDKENTLFVEVAKARELLDSLTKELSELENVKFSSFTKLRAFLDRGLRKQIEDHRRLYEFKRNELEKCKFFIREKETLLKLLRKDKEELLRKIELTLRDFNEVEGAYSDLEKRLCGEGLDSDMSVCPFGKLSYVNSIYEFLFLEKDTLTEERKREVFKSAPYDFRNSELSVKRIKLFLKALELHKLVIFKHRDKFSFLLKKFINILRSPRVEVKDDDVSLESLWDVFFFVVPVTSTTLASFSRMFGLVGDEFIDYLLVDEAGQAQVHSFVLPLVKSKRAIIVGDPFQIEPVYNITSGLDDILCSFFEIPLEFSVTENSVQTYADRVSLLGGIYEVGGRKVRVGVPLNVHRRCNSPMFDIANRIAYSDCMIKGKMDSFKVRDLLPERLRVSRWFHVEFKPNESGIVEEEIKLLSELLVEIERSLVEKEVDVREFVKKGNIFVITPFRAVRDRLRDLKKEGGIRSYLVKEGDFIGTIHTFQGKEANIVFVVLGGRSERSMAWASSKPNLLNVALTRAKELCFIIGDRNLWGRMPYFKDAVKILDRWSEA